MNDQDVHGAKSFTDSHSEDTSYLVHYLCPWWQFKPLAPLSSCNQTPWLKLKLKYTSNRSQFISSNPTKQRTTKLYETNKEGTIPAFMVALPACCLAATTAEPLIEHYGSPGTNADRWFMSALTTPACEPNPDKGRARLEQAGWWIDYTIQRPVSLERGKRERRSSGHLANVASHCVCECVAVCIHLHTPVGVCVRVGSEGPERWLLPQQKQVGN